MLSEANFLILDEPTNHLDITSKEILENAIRHYTGTVLYVSHDRYFINKTATRILDLTNNQLLNYIGNYDYYLEKKKDVESAANLSSSTGSTKVNSTPWANTATAASSVSSENKLDWQQQKEEKAKLRKKQNDLKKCEDEISTLETRNEEIDELLTKEEIFTDVPKLMELNNEKKQIEERLEELMVLWEELAD